MNLDDEESQGFFAEKCRDGSLDLSERWTPIISESLQDDSFFNNLFSQLSCPAVSYRL